MASFNISTALNFVGQLGVSYTLSRFLQPDGPRLTGLTIAGGDYGAPMARVYGEAVRLPVAFIAQAQIKETKHTTDSTAGIIIGAISGAQQGFAIGGPIGAVVGGILGGLFGSKKHHYYTYSDTFGALIADRTSDDPIEAVLKIWAAGRVLFDSTQQSPIVELLDGDQLVARKFGPNRYFSSLTIYGGGGIQTADPTLIAALGEQPGYRHSAYIVVEELQLVSFGNAVPTPIEVLVVAKTGQTLADAAEAICSAAGIDASHNLSTTALAGKVMGGYAVTEEKNCWDALSPLMPVFRVDGGDINGQVRFYGREQGLRATIPLDALGAYEYGTTPPERIQYQRKEDIGLPRETALTFIDPARDYQPNTATSRRSEGDAKSNVATTLNITMTADEAASAAATIHWDAWLGRTGISTSLTDGWNGLTPGLCFGVPFDIGGDQIVLPYRVTRKTRGANGIIEAELVSAENVVVRGVTVGAAVPLPSDDDTAIAETRAVFIDMPMIQDLHDDFGFYIALGSNKSYWEQGRVDVDTGSAWGTLIDGSEVAVVGDVTGTLSAGPTDGLDDTLDTTSVLTVETMHPGIVLTNATDTELDAWANFAYVGKNGQGEYLQYKTATRIGPTTWELTNLRRGRRGTDWAMAAHVSGEEFALMGNGGIYRLPYTNSDSWGTEYNYRAVTLHQDETTATVQAFTNTGEAKKPFSPIHLQGSFDVGSGDLTLTWERRLRFFDGMLHTDAPESYELDIYAGALFKRTIDASVEEALYSAADQASDGFTDGDAITVRLYQVNTDYGRGHVRVGIFLAPAFTMHMEDGTTPVLMEDDFTPIGLG